MGLSLMIIINVSIFKDGEVGNLRKSKYFYDFFLTFTNARKYNLISDNIF